MIKTRKSQMIECIDHRVVDFGYYVEIKIMKGIIFNIKKHIDKNLSQTLGVAFFYFNIKFKHRGFETRWM